MCCCYGAAALGRLDQKKSHRFGGGAKFVFAVLATLMWSIFADAGSRIDKTIPHYELFSGVDATSSSIFGYAGAVWAFGRNVSGEGMRIKALSGFGGYDYDSSLPGVAGQVNFNGDVVLAQLLGGYLWRRGEWTIKAYMGLGFEDHDIAPNDPANSVNGSEFGVMGQLELWRNLGENNWFSADASYGDLFGSYWTQMRLGHRFGKRISAGIEGGVLGNEEYDSGRGGGFLRYHLGEMELTVSGGISGTYYEEDTGAYAAMGLYRKF